MLVSIQSIMFRSVLTSQLCSSTLVSPGRGVIRSCSAEIIGHVEVDFVASREAGKLRLWAVDLSVSPTASLSGFQLFDFLAAGQFDPATGAYWVPGMPETPAALLPNQQSEADHTAYAMDRQQATVQSAVQPVDEDMQQGAASPAQESCSVSQAAASLAAASHGSTDGGHAADNRLQSAEVDTEHGGGLSSVCDQSTSTGLGSDTTLEAARCQQDAASGAAIAARSAAGTGLLTELSDNGLESDSSEAALGPVPNSGNHQEQGLDEVASVPEEDQDAGQVHADRLRQPAPAMQQEVQLEPRFFAAIDLLFHSGMHKRRSTEFLQNCRVAGLGFDMMARQGLVLNLMDSMSSCCLGVQCAGATPQLALQGLSKVMTLFDLISSLLCLVSSHV